MANKVTIIHNIDVDSLNEQRDWLIAHGRVVGNQEKEHVDELIALLTRMLDIAREEHNA